MATKIQWAEETWNPITGCTPVSAGCNRCYAKRMAQRLRGRFGYPQDDPFKPGTVHEDKMDLPFRWRKPRRVFVSSMGDLFNPGVKFEWIERVFEVMRKTPHIYIVLTKRPRDARMFLDPNLRSDTFKSWPFPNVWLGVSVENQKAANERIPVLLDTPAAVRFVSCEPLLEPVDITPYVSYTDYCPAHDYGDPGYPPAECSYCHRVPGIDWVIAGPETGPGARAMDLDWARSLRDQCTKAKVPFFYKPGALDGEKWEQYPKGDFTCSIT